MTCSAIRRSLRKPRARRPSALNLWPCWATSRRSSSASVRRWFSRLFWSPQIPWQCRFANGRGKSPSSRLWASPAAGSWRFRQRGSRLIPGGGIDWRRAWVHSWCMGFRIRHSMTFFPTEDDPGNLVQRRCLRPDSWDCSAQPCPRITLRKSTLSMAFAISGNGMTLGSFVIRNAFRNKRRSLLTMISISFSLLLLTMMICIWRSFYIDQVAPEAARRLIIRDRVSLAFFLPAFYREKIRAVPGVNAVAPLTWFGGRYIDDRPEHFFAQMATDPDEYLKVASDKIISPDASESLAARSGGSDRRRDARRQVRMEAGRSSHVAGEYFPDESRSDDSRRFITAILRRTRCTLTPSIWRKRSPGSRDKRDGTRRRSIPRIMSPRPPEQIDDMFHNSPLQTKTESEKAFQLGFVASLGNVKAFILSICGAVVFAIMLVSANTMAMSVRSRTREVAA